MSKKKHELHEEHPDERWLVSYSDMITVLMCLFIVLFAMSQVDQNKFSALAQGLAESFGENNTIMTGRSTIQDQAGSTVVNAPYSQGDADTAREAARTAQIKSDAVKQAADLAKQQQYGQAKEETDSMTKVAKQIQAALSAKGLNGDLQASFDDRGLVLSMVSRHAVFESNLATLTPRGQQVVSAMGDVVKSLPNDIEVDGHTNQAKGKPKYYATDWDLAYARASTVLNYMTDIRGVPEDRIHAASFGHTKPLVPVSTPDSQEINKRVDIVVLSNRSEAVRALLKQAAAQQAQSESQAASQAGTESATDGTEPSSTEGSK